MDKDLDNLKLGSLPKAGFAKLVPELLVEDLDISLSFWRDLLGFEIAYQRPEQGFAYLERAEGAQIMLCKRSGNWETAAMERPFGRGVMFQVQVKNLDSLYASFVSSGKPIHTPMREVWRRYGDREGWRREFCVQDPDGYLVMMGEQIGERPLS